MSAQFPMSGEPVQRGQVLHKFETKAAMTASEAIQELDAMQRQIIHGSNIFGDIADVIRDQQKQINALNRTIDTQRSSH